MIPIFHNKVLLKTLRSHHPSNESAHSKFATFNLVFRVVRFPLMGLSTWAKGRKAETPGPGTYSVPAPFGSGPHYTMKGRTRDRLPDPEPAIISLPSTLVFRTTTFGYRPKEKAIDPTPGPNLTPPPIGRDAPKFTLKFKHPDPPNTNPGPADYTISREFPGPRQTISSGPRYSLSLTSSAPIGLYKLPSSFDTHKSVTIGSRLPSPEPERAGPGPGKYGAPSTIGTGPAYSVPRGPRDWVFSDNPGPADYQRLRPLTSETQIGTSFKGAVRAPEGDKHDYPYYSIPGTIVPRKKSHGVRPETSYETPSPGPAAYTVGGGITPKQKTIGVKSPQKVVGTEDPGPADYFKTEITPKPPPFCGFYGPEDRSLIDARKEREKPGPGAYDETREFDTIRKGFYFTSRNFDEYIADTSAPYIGQISGLGGPRWTIGNKDA